jgi:hypothetical protein
MESIEQSVLRVVENRIDKRPVLLCDRLNEDLWLDGMEIAGLALELQELVGRKPTAQAYRTVFTVADLVAVFEQAPPARAVGRVTFPDTRSRRPKERRTRTSDKITHVMLWAFLSALSCGFALFADGMADGKVSSLNGLGIDLRTLNPGLLLRAVFWLMILGPVGWLVAIVIAWRKDTASRRDQ